MKPISTKLICTTGTPTIFFLINHMFETLVLLDEGITSKNMRYDAFDSFGFTTVELFDYEH